MAEPTYQEMNLFFVILSSPLIFLTAAYLNDAISGEVLIYSLTTAAVASLFLTIFLWYRTFAPEIDLRKFSIRASFLMIGILVVILIGPITWAFTTILG